MRRLFDQPRFFNNCDVLYENFTRVKNFSEEYPENVKKINEYFSNEVQNLWVKIWKEN